MATANLKALFIVAMTLSASVSLGAPRGAFKATDAYCTNPDFVFNQEEKDYIRAVRGEGSCKSGRYTDFPCFEDYYVFGPDDFAQTVNKTTDIRGVSCVVRTVGKFKEEAPGILSLVFGPQKAQKQQTDDVQISCGFNSEDSNGDAFKLKYRMKGEKFLVIFGSDGGDCGEYIIEHSPVEKAP